MQIILTDMLPFWAMPRSFLGMAGKKTETERRRQVDAASQIALRGDLPAVGKGGNKRRKNCTKNAAHRQSRYTN